MDKGSNAYSVSAIGQDHHAFLSEAKKDNFIKLAAVSIPFDYGFEANSDGDVVLHALCNALSGLSCENILGFSADKLCKSGIKDSRAYLELALSTIKGKYKLLHVSVAIEAKRPILKPYLPEMRSSLALLLGLRSQDIGITVTTGEALTGMGEGRGICAICIVSALKFV